MSRLSDVVKKFGQFTTSDLTLDHIDELRECLKNIDSKDVSTLKEHMDYLDLLKLFRESLVRMDKAHGENFLTWIASTLGVGEDGLYSNKLRFLFELIQNVDDCEYIDASDAHLNVEFSADEGKIIFTYNETGFRPFNVFAITGIAEAAKNINSDSVEIGEKGIGFKSVFGIAEKVHIQSGYFSFELYKDNFTVPVSVYDNFKKVDGTRLTLFVAPELVYTLYDSFVNEYSSKDVLLNKNPLIFLNKLTKLELKNGSRYLKFEVDRIKNEYVDFTKEENVKISMSSKDLSGRFDDEVICTRYTQPIIYSDDMRKARYGDSYSDGKSKRMYIHIVVPEFEYISGTDGVEIGALYSFLPTQIRMSVPFVCHVPFKLNSSREFIDPQNNNSWFRHSCGVLCDVLEYVFMDISKRYREESVIYLPEKGRYLFESGNDKVRCLQNEVFKGDHFLTLPVFHTANGNYKSSSEIFIFSHREYIPDHRKACELLNLTDKELFIYPNVNAWKEFGITVVGGIADKLFARAIEIESVTGEIFEFLSLIDTFNFSKNVSKLEEASITVAQLKVIASYPDCLEAFNKQALTLIKKGELPKFNVRTYGLSLESILDISFGGSAVEIDDFDENARKYLNDIDCRCLIVDDVPEDMFFASEDVLILSDENTIGSLAEFCIQVDKNSTFAITLKLRKASNRLNRADKNMPAMDYLRTLNIVRRTIRDVLGKKAYENYVSLINQSGMNSKRYISELIQNADDCTYPIGEEPIFELTVSKDRKKVTTFYNEVGFTHENVRAITAIGESTKKQLLSNTINTEIGEKGVGFKSVFSVAKEVVIHSGDFKFGLEDTNPTIPRPAKESPEHLSGTKMFFKMKEPVSKSDFSEENILRLCICLRKLKKIRIDGIEIKIEDIDDTRKITLNDKIYEYNIIRHEFRVDDQSAINEREGNSRKLSNQQEIVCYIPKKESKENCYLYSGLPTNVKINVPLIIDAPFELTTSREQLINNGWNEIIKKNVYDAYIGVINYLKTTKGIKVLKWIAFVSSSSGYTSEYKWNLFNDSELNIYGKIVGRLQNTAFIPTYGGTYMSPVQVFRFDESINILLAHGEDIGYSKNKLIKGDSPAYRSVLSALGVAHKPINEQISVLKQHYSKYMTDDKFRKYLYDFLISVPKQNVSIREDLKTWQIIPILPRKKSNLDFVAWSSGSIFVKGKVEEYPDYCNILDEQKLSKHDLEDMLKVHINIFDEKYDERLYWNSVCEVIDRHDGVKTYMFLMNEFNTNRERLIKCIANLRDKMHIIPMKNELGEIEAGHRYINDVQSGYFTGDILRKHLVHSECKEFAIFMGCKKITDKDIYYESFRIRNELTEDDVEDILDDHIANGTMILQKCLDNKLIPDALVEKYNLVVYRPDSKEIVDLNFLNQPVNDAQFEKHIRKVLAKRGEIKHEERTRSVRVVRFADGSKFDLDNTEVRRVALSRYSPESGYCMCQMCKQVRLLRAIEVNNIQLKRDYYYDECGIALCLNCSSTYKMLRAVPDIYDRFITELKNANYKQNKPVSVSINDKNIIFSQTHIAELQRILKDGQK